jgi:uncharacterized protein
VRIVLDSNVLVAAFASRGLCEAVYEVCLAEHQLVASEEILREVEKALRTRIKLSPEVAAQIVAHIHENALIVEPSIIECEICRDPNDLHVLGLISAAPADCLVTGDHDLLSMKFFHAIPILSPRAFHDWLH